MKSIIVKLIYFLITVLILPISFSCKSEVNSTEKIVVAYLQSGGNRLPDPTLMTHIIYAFGDFNDNNDGLVIPNPEKLEKLVKLKELKPDLKIILGVGGYKREGFSEMTGDENRMIAFVDCCDSIIRTYDLDGIDLDWEFPTTTTGGHTASPDDDINYVKLVKALRAKLGPDKHISIYSNNSARWINFKTMVPFLDYVNVSGYNLRVKEGHQSNLYSSKICGDWSVDESITRHINKGVPPEKILLGIPFFGRGREPFPSFLEDYKIDQYKDKAHLKWDKKAKVPYYADDNGVIVLGFDDPKSVKIKCQYTQDKNLGGVFYWNYDADFLDHTLAKTIQESLLND